MSPVGLGELLQGLAPTSDDNLLVGFTTRDDAAVYRIADDRAVVLTADFITPPVDDPHTFGAIAAANALSDVYAMGAQPALCLNLAGFPSKDLPPEVLQGILAGALEKISEAGAVLGGGHTTEDDEPKFGLAVMGFVHPDRLWTNAGAKPGDALLLTKPIGSGVLFNAHRKGWVSAAAMDECIANLLTLNRRAAQALADFDVHGATDVTGFGLAGHALEMARASEATLHLEIAQLPVLKQAREMYRRGMTTGVNEANREQVASHWRLPADLPQEERELLIDPQTSGGLLVALPEEQAQAALSALREADAPAAKRIGRVASGPGILILS
ncbi:MAG: selenide, water dikinase SelD [Acidobacteriota bacterium]